MAASTLKLVVIIVLWYVLNVQVIPVLRIYTNAYILQLPVIQ